MFIKAFKTKRLGFRAFLVCAGTLIILITAFYGLNRAVKTFVYPLPHKETVFRFSAENGLNNALVYAVIKTESNFNPQAVSQKGAKGLMQITESTAKYIAKLKNVDKYDLFDENTNIEFGCFYLAYLSERFSSTDLAIVAYNAGEGNVCKWLNNPKYSDDKKSLKAIPFPETRAYLKKVKKTFEKYKNLYPYILDK